MPSNPKHYLDENGLLYYDGIVQDRLDEKADESDVPTTVAELTDSGDYALKTDLTTKADISDIPTTVAELSDSSNYALKTDLVGGVTYKGTVASYSNLPQSGMAVGDMWNITNADSTHGIEAGDNVIWSGSAWDVQRGTIDMSGYYNSSNFLPITNAEIDELLSEL